MLLKDTSAHLPGDVESLSAALSVAGHAGSTGSLALPPMVLTDVTGLVEQHKWGKNASDGNVCLVSVAPALPLQTYTACSCVFKLNHCLGRVVDKTLLNVSRSYTVND